MNADVKEDPPVLKPIPNREYVTAFKLYFIVAAVAFVSFLMLPDNMIVSAVGCAPSTKSMQADRAT